MILKRPITFIQEKKHADSLARAGAIETPHGVIQTPAFIGVATKGTAKGLPSYEFKNLGLQAVIANAYHLYLTPGADVVSHAGGIGRFMSWDGPTMTDSGGFQVFSLGVGFGKQVSKISREEKPRDAGIAVYDEDVMSEHGKLAVVDDEGVTFTSHHDGSLHRFTPERSIEIQHDLGADIIFAFDEFIASTEPREDQKASMDRTHRWAVRSLKAHRINVEANARQGIYGIVQGGRYADLRIESATCLAGMDFDGYGIGGTFSKLDITGILDTVNRILPEDKPRHLLGIGEPEDMLIGVASGIDTFDCVVPTRNGRNGTVYTEDGKYSIERAEHARDMRPIDPACSCVVCRTYSRSYVHHLFRSKEMLGLVLASMHNMHFLAHFAARIREAILNDTFAEFSARFLHRYMRS